MPLSKLIIGNTRGFIRGKTLATLNDIPASIDTYTKSQIDSKLNGKANSSHTHNISDISGLQNQLNNFVTADQVYEIIENANKFDDGDSIHITSLPYTFVVGFFPGHIIIKAGSTFTIRAAYLTGSGGGQSTASFDCTISNDTTIYNNNTSIKVFQSYLGSSRAYFYLKLSTSGILSADAYFENYSIINSTIRVTLASIICEVYR